ncbi:MAG TPA: hypothetical protein VMH39_01810 [Gemmatimonadaceae bacterium]|nr:hypothetical protein [Gemmatimonadaceae bacterium]
MVVAIACTAIVFGALTKIVVTIVNRPRGIGLGADRMRSVDERLARIEQAIDAMSVEVERISEGQRFTTKLLSERADARATEEPSRAISTGLP